MRISLDIRIVKDESGKRALRVWPEIEGTTNHKNAIAILILVVLATASLYAVASTPDPIIEPTLTIVGGY